jgi:hypothetical protein
MAITATIRRDRPHAAAGLLGRGQERLEGHRRHLITLGHVGLDALQVGAELGRRFRDLDRRLDHRLVDNRRTDRRFSTQTTKGQTLNAVIGDT